jgi:hypothetical protein
METINVIHEKMKIKIIMENRSSTLEEMKNSMNGIREEQIGK